VLLRLVARRAEDGQAILGDAADVEALAALERRLALLGGRSLRVAPAHR